MTTSIAPNQSQSCFSVSHTRFTPSWNYTRSLSSRSSRSQFWEAQQLFSLQPQFPVWTLRGTNRHRRSARGRRTQTAARKRLTGTERPEEECWRSWSRGAVRRRSGLWSQRMNSGLWGEIFPRTMSWVSGLSRRVSFVNVNLVLFNPVQSHSSTGVIHLPSANCGLAPSLQTIWQ